jgi:hypothetical protein
VEAGEVERKARVDMDCPASLKLELFFSSAFMKLASQGSSVKM